MCKWKDVILMSANPINPKKLRGTQTLSEAQHWAMSSKGGKAKIPTKGFGKLTHEQCVENGKRAYALKVAKHEERSNL